MLSLLVTFAGVACLAALVPGPDTAVVIKSGVVSGRSKAVATAAGCSTGHLGGAASMAGVAAVLATSVAAFTRPRWC